MSEMRQRVGRLVIAFWEVVEYFFGIDLARDLALSRGPTIREIASFIERNGPVRLAEIVEEFDQPREDIKARLDWMVEQDWGPQIVRGNREYLSQEEEDYDV